MDKYEYLKNESLATAGNCCTIIGCVAGFAGSQVQVCTMMFLPQMQRKLICHYKE